MTEGARGPGWTDEKERKRTRREVGGEGRAGENRGERGKE